MKCYWWCFLSFLLTVGLTDIASSDAVSKLCIRCPGRASNTLVGLHCIDNKTSSVVNRCCIQNFTVIGLDWSNCGINITKLDPYQFSSVGDSLLWLDLSDNDVQFNTSLRDRWFGALTNLKLLLLPVGVNCSKEAWGSSKTLGQNNTLQLCSNPLYCNASGDKASNNSICPPDSHCVPDGPGLHQCVCNSGYHGYKCIQQTGLFPYALFFSTSVATALAVVVLDWIIRRLIRRRQHSGV